MWKISRGPYIFSSCISVYEFIYLVHILVIHIGKWSNIDSVTPCVVRSFNAQKYEQQLTATRGRWDSEEKKVCHVWTWTKIFIHPWQNWHKCSCGRSSWNMNKIISITLLWHARKQGAVSRQRAGTSTLVSALDLNFCVNTFFKGSKDEGFSPGLCGILIAVDWESQSQP